VVCTIEEGDAPADSSDKKEPSESAQKSAPEKEEKDSSSNSYASGTASPAAAKILREKGIDPTSIKGTGKDGRITKEDAEKAQAKSDKPEKSSAPAPAAAATHNAPGERKERREKMTSLRKT